MSIPITTLYIGLAGIIYFVLSILAVGARQDTGVTLGESTKKEHEPLLRKVRAHSNFAEYTLFLLALMAALELGGASWIFLFAFGDIVLAGRVLHAYGIIKSDRTKFRIIGMHLTLWPLLIASLYAAWIGAHEAWVLFF